VTPTPTGSDKQCSCWRLAPTARGGITCSWSREGLAHLELLGAPCARSELDRLVCEFVLKRCGAKEWWHGGDSRSEWQMREREEGGWAGG
jgi:hypothetical protein